MRFAKKVLSLLFVLLFVLIATESVSDAAAKKIVFLTKNQTNPFFVEMKDAVERKCAELGWEVKTLYPMTPDNNEQQIQLLEQSLLNPPDLFIITPADSHGITPAIEQINDAGIPIINCNTKFYDPDIKYLTFVAFQNFDGAKLSVETGAKLIGYKGNVIILEGVTGAQTSIDRTDGAKAAIAEHKDLTLLAQQTTNYSRPEALQVMQDFLQKYPKIDLVFGASAEVALGAAEAIRQAGRQKEITLVTINTYKEAIEAVKDGRVTLTVDDQSWKQGEECVLAAKRYFDGETLPPAIMIEGKVIDSSNAEEFAQKWK
ncbi:sugar ABC transporter substrate-binding protein [Synergistales bacterium]|nr:sugar ABC transporter substrate-binding protein [Synergistales bacterium]